MARYLLVLLAGLVMAAPAGAAPNWLGQTGLLLTPTADALDSGDYNVTFHHISDVANIAAASLGLAQGLEVGLVFYDPERRRAEEKLTGHVKYRLIPETAEGVGLAVGWWDVADEVDNTPYAVVSKKVTTVERKPLRAHIGAGGGRYDGVFAGADLSLAVNLLAMVEYDGHDLNAGIRVGLPRGFRVDIGFVSDQFGIGASYNARF